MDSELLQEVLDCLRGDRTLYNYYPDKYAVYLLKRVVSEDNRSSIGDIRNSKWSCLLKRPTLRDLLAKSGSGYLDGRDLKDLWHNYSEPYVLTLGEWGGYNDWGWNQTSRPGKNLVLQLNLSGTWSRRFTKLMRATPNQYFDCGHPLSETRPITLAWARMDIDFATDEVLIEEVQSDLVRYIARMKRLAITAQSRGVTQFSHYGDNIDAKAFEKFASDFLMCFGKSWQETMLAASMEFIFDELGISAFYYHSFETGNVMKNLEFSYPPKSLYTDLPKRFCFSKTQEAPKFLMNEKKIRRKLRALKDHRWFYMAA